MGCGNNQAAARKMLAHQTRQQALSGSVKGRVRLVHQPERPPHREQAGQRQPPSLPGREIGGGQVNGMVEPDRAQALGCVRHLAAKKLTPE